MKKIIMAMILLFLATPCSLFASEKVSRNFPEQLTYFPMKTGGMLFVRNQNGNFYYSKHPEISGGWNQSKLTTQMNTFSNIQAIHFNNHTYIIGGSMDGKLKNNQVLRMKDENPSKIKVALDFNDTFNADSLAVFKNFLYISTASNNLFKTADGTNWTLVNTKGLPAAPGKIITTTNKMFAVLDSEYYTGTYYSKDGEQWHLLSKKYYIETVYQDNAYFTKKIDNNTGLYKQKQRKRFKKISSLTNANYHGTSQGIIAVINTSTPNELSYKVYKSVNNDKFNKVDNGNAMVADVIDVNNEILLMVSTNEGYNSYLKKI